MNLKKIMNSIVVILCGLLLTHCNTTTPPGDYDTAEVGKIKKVVSGTIVSNREVRLHKNAGASANRADNSMNHSHGYEYVIRLTNGSIISVVQAGDVKLKPKQRVLVINGANTRVVPDRGGEDY